METEYVEKQVALEAMKQLPHEYQTKEQRARTGGIAACQMVVRSIPPADVRPVVRGKWEHLNWGFDYDRCSECGYEHRWPGPFYFCPNCGADMRME